jgi:GTP diphosphokinase / guanosine-3',5'-bis(diphosphate) 3'-diphosphatase
LLYNQNTPRIHLAMIEPNTVKNAKLFAKKAYEDHYRFNGESYFEHATNVYNALLKVGVTDEDILSCAFLHKVLKINPTVESNIETQFGEKIHKILVNLHKLSNKPIKKGAINEFNETYVIQTFLSMAEDMEVAIIRIADKTVSTRSIHVFDKIKKLEIAKQAMYVYAPICRLIGISKFTTELENNAFKVMDPRRYFQIERYMRELTPKIEAFFSQTIPVLQDLLEENGVKPEIKSRIKHIYGLYRKSLNSTYVEFDVGREPQVIPDVAGIMILVNNVDDCYKTEDILKQIWEVVTNERDDYIQNPRPSGYKAIHNFFVSRRGIKLEIQIKTHEMHEYNEFGPASHFIYKLSSAKTGSIRTARNLIMKMKSDPYWLKELNYWKIEKNSHHDKLKIQQFDKFIYVFTPKNDIIELPKGSTVLDFAYSIHAGVGNSCIGATVNDKIARLSDEIKDGDVVKIKTQKKKTNPSEDWLSFVKTKKARDLIKKGLSR